MVEYLSPSYCNFGLRTFDPFFSSFKPTYCKGCHSKGRSDLWTRSYTSWGCHIKNKQHKTGGKIKSYRAAKGQITRISANFAGITFMPISQQRDVGSKSTLAHSIQHDDYHKVSETLDPKHSSPARTTKE